MSEETVPPIHVSVHAANGVRPSVKSRRDPDGSVHIDIDVVADVELIERAIADRIRRGLASSLAMSLEHSYGIKRTRG